MTENNVYPNIVSFVIRFVQDDPVSKAGEPAYRGSVRHIQTDSEITFTNWEDAMVFMQNYVEVIPQITPKKTED